MAMSKWEEAWWAAKPSTKKKSTARDYYELMQQCAQTARGALRRIDIYMNSDFPIDMVVELCNEAQETAALAASTMMTFEGLWREAVIEERRAFAFGNNQEAA
jgi:hypothetical protein